MIKTSFLLPLLLLFLVLSGCGDGGSEPDQVQIDKENPFRVQVDAIKQAREVEQLVQDHAEQRYQLIEEKIR